MNRSMTPLIGVAVLGSLCSGRALIAQNCSHQWTAELHTGVWEFEVFDHGAGPRLYGVTYGSFSSFGTYVSRGIARWAGDRWENIGDLSPASAYALEVFDDGSGPALYVGGEFYKADGLYAAPNYFGGVVSPTLARFDGTAWSAVGGLGFGPIAAELATFDDGTGPVLVMGGWFPSGVAGTGSTHIGAWDGKRWSGLSTGMDSAVGSLAVFDDDGSGPNPASLFVGGTFDYAGSVYASRIARWDGRQWHAVGPGMDPGNGNGPVGELCVYDDGVGPALYAGGTFAGVYGVPGTDRLARWNGAAWSAVATTNGQYVFGLFVFDDGVRGPGLIVGGNFSSIAGMSALGMARYDRSGWSTLGDPNGGWAGAMTRFDEGGVPTLWVSGGFQLTPTVQTALGRYQYVCEPCYPDCDGSGALTVADFGCFRGKYVLADPYADCNASGNLTVADFGCFQGKYVLGCP